MKLKQYLNENETSDRKIIGRDHKLSMIYDKLEGKAKAKDKFIETVKTKGEYYDKISDIVKEHYGLIRKDYNISTLEGRAEFMNDLRKKLSKVHKFTPKFYNSLSKDKVSLSGWGNFTLNTSWDMTDYLTAAVMKAKGYDNPDDHKKWLKK